MMWNQKEEAQIVALVKRMCVRPACAAGWHVARHCTTMPPIGSTMRILEQVPVRRVLEQDLGMLRGRAVDDLVAATEGLVRWADRVRDPRAPFRFCWAVDSLRAVDVASTSYILNRLADTGVWGECTLRSNRRIPTWLMWDMARPLPQVDAFGLAIFGSGFDICVDLLGIQRQTGWSGRWRFDARDADSDRDLGRELAAQLGLEPCREALH